MANNLLATFLAAAQASSSVLLVAVYGILAGELNILDAPATKKISALCVRMALPALLVTRLGGELEQDTWMRYIPVFAWALFYNVLSLCLGMSAVKLFKLPRWLPVTIAFNNTTSLPLLLTRALESTGVFERLLVGDDTSAAAITRAQSYFLVNSMVGNCLTFAIGPRLMRPPEPSTTGVMRRKSHSDSDSEDGSPLRESSRERASTERASLLPGSGHQLEAESTNEPPRMTKEKVLRHLRDFFNEPTIGAVIGLILGVTPSLHRSFFGSTSEGGLFTAWLTASLVSLGQSFVPLQVIVVGFTLSASFHQGHFSRNQQHRQGFLKRFGPTLVVLLIRFAIWPLVSLVLIYLLATYTNILSQDPVLWFTMILMPAGPPAMKLIAMANVGDAEESAKISVARILAIAYICVPLLSFSVVGALNAVEKAMRVTGRTS